VVEKRTGPALSVDDLGTVEAVLLGHDQHFDNFDWAGRQFLHRVKNAFTTPSGAKRLGGSERGLSPWEQHTSIRHHR
jgi:hypothetical protein